MDEWAVDRAPDDGQDATEPALTARQAAARLGVDERTVRRAIARGELRAAKRAGVFRIAPSDLAHFRTRRSRTGPPAGSGPGRVPAAAERRWRAPPRLLPLPAPSTPFVGREREVAALVAELRREEVRLLTLTGPGGVGKTRLALQAAAEAAVDFPDGVRFVGLAQVTDPALVVPAIAQAFGLREADAEPFETRLLAVLRDRRLLLILDNFEHVIVAAPVVTGLLAACSRLTALVTSRVRLRVSGEHERAVPPLGVPEPGGRGPGWDVTKLARSESVRLFVERAQAAQAGFALTSQDAAAVAEICRRLDGLPLAIELAAAWVKVLPPSELLARLDRRLVLLTGGPRDLPSRLQTMRDAIAWSHDLLTDDERALFRRLAVFAGGFTLDAAEYVGGAEGMAPPPERSATPSALDLVASLLDKSLLRAEGAAGGETRYRMLETIREFGLERLADSGEGDAARRRHAGWCLALAEAVGPKVRTWERAASTARFDAEHDNLRTALAWLQATGSVDDALRLGDALHIFWYVRGHAGEGLRWLERALAANPASVSPVRAKALLAAAHLAHHRGDDDRACEHLAACLDCYRALGDRPGQAFPLHVLGMIAEDRGDYARAATLLEEARALFLAAGNGTYAANALYHLGIVAYGQGAVDPAIERYEAAIAEARAAGDAYTAAAALSYLGLARCDRGEEALAVEAITESLTLYRGANDLIGLARGVAHLAAIARAGREPNAAARLFGAFDTLTEPVGYGFAHPEVVRYERSRAALRAEMGEAAYAAATVGGRSLRLETALDEAVSIGEMIATRARRGGDSPARFPAPYGLSLREREVLRLLAGGLSNREIAERLFISPATVARHVSNLFGKLGVDSRAKAVAYAHRHGLA